MTDTEGTDIEGMLREAFGRVDRIVNLNREMRQEQDRVEVAKWRGQVTRKVAACRSCDLSRGQHPPVAFRGPSAATGAGSDDACLVIGESSRPLTNQRLLEAMMQEAEIDPDKCMWAGAVSCPSTLLPKDLQILACRNNLLDVIEVSGFRKVLLVGAVAASTWRQDLKLKQVRGKVGFMLDAWCVMATVHPATAAMNRAGEKGTLQRDLQLWSRVLKSDTPSMFLGHTCVMEDGEAVEFDPDGIGWCQKCWNKKGGKDAWKRARGRWELGSDYRPQQGTLL